MATSTPEPLYLDYSASTPLSEEVIDAMLPWLKNAHGNPHATHWHGRQAAGAIESARADIADLIGAAPEEIIFTSGATEANNLALKGLLSSCSLRRQLWLTDIEHKSILEPGRILAASGIQMRHLHVTQDGLIDLERFESDLANEESALGLIAIGHGNNEIGTVQPIATIAKTAHTHNHILHVDASQSAGRIRLNVDKLNCDLLCISSHKIYGPSGIGALYISEELKQELQPQIHGGGQEGGLRSGTVPTFLAVGFGKAAKLTAQALSEPGHHQSHLVDHFLRCLGDSQIEHELIGHAEQRLPGHASVRFPGVDAEDLLTVLAPSLSASTGSACAAGELRASPVLRALGLDEQTASEVIRFTFGRMSDMESANTAANIIASAVTRIYDRNRKTTS